MLKKKKKEILQESTVSFEYLLSVNNCPTYSHVWVISDRRQVNNPVVWVENMKGYVHNSY